ncbi:VanZ family protein [Streptomyces sp. LHD-70]|uniref:VanZ family protein n=1 Tax=Streptomyces sp. LHD-70 TaxID=3072140 RepID=UPI00280E60B3|nr:VanZ family protein [Streptomyces sp. LHD-70]MDQ8705009.1 VanZ family protein [Streptomyces sp. LHD-70]
MARTQAGNSTTGAAGSRRSRRRRSFAGPRAQPDEKPDKKPDKSPPGPQLPLLARLLLMAVAFAAMAAFAVVLARLTVSPQPASEALTHSNLHPGSSIRQYLAQPEVLDAVKQLGGNVALGVPFGVLLPLLFPRTRGRLRVALTTAGVMLLVELVQGALVTGRAFDIDDVVLNTTGALLGYLLLGRRLGRAVHPPRRPWWRRFGRGRTASGSHT